MLAEARSTMVNWSFQMPFSTSMNPATAADLFITAYGNCTTTQRFSWIAALGYKSS